MPTDLAQDLTTPFVTNGVLGTSVVVLALVILKLWTELKSERAAHKTELAAKDALINQLYEDRIAEARVGFDIARSNQSTLDAFLAALRGKGQS